LERLGIAEQLKAKTKLLPPSNPAAHAVANGEADIGMGAARGVVGIRCAISSNLKLPDQAARSIG
jgi:hypothetical protein